MTKVQIRFQIERALNDESLTGIRDAQAAYGIEKIQLAPDMQSLTVDYDASRLRATDVEALLEAKGIPIRRQA